MANFASPESENIKAGAAGDSRNQQAASAHGKADGGASTDDEFPTELLDRIFLLSLLNDVSPQNIAASRTNLRLVCSRWNDVILAQPRFWTNIFVDVPIENHVLFSKPISAETTDKAIASVQQSIERSGILPCHLNVTALAPSPRLVSFIQSARDRWNSIDMFVGRNFPLVTDVFEARNPREIDIPPGTWKALRSLTVKTSKALLPVNFAGLAEWSDVAEDMQAAGVYPDSDSLLEDWPKIVMSSTSAPSLRSVTLHLPGRSIYQWELPWSQITHLDVAGLAHPMIGMLRFLSRFDALESLSITLEPVSSALGGFPHSGMMLSMQRAGILPMPHLHTLRVKATTLCDVLPNLIGHIVTPRLNHVSYENTWDTYDRDGDSFAFEALQWLATLIKRSKSDLKSFDMRLAQATLDDRAITEVLEANLFPTLESLTLGAIDLECGFLSMVKNGPLPPNVKKVEFISYSTEGRIPKADFAKWAKEWVTDSRCQEEKDGVKRKDVLEARFVTMLQRSFSPELADVVVELDELYEGEEWGIVKTLQEEGWNVRAEIEYD